MAVIFSTGAGLIMGSFLSVLVERWPHWRGVFAGRSRCLHCGHVLAWVDLVPLASWLFLRGRCRYCHARISPKYPAYELVMATVFGVYVWQQGADIPAFVMLFGFVALFFFDLRHMVLPDAILAPMAVVAAVWSPFPLAVVPALVLVAVFGVVHVAGRGRLLGLGDVKMAGVIGLWWGWSWVPVTLFAVWAGAIVGIALLVLGRATRRTPLPLGSFWAASSVIFMSQPVLFDRLLSFFSL